MLGSCSFRSFVRLAGWLAAAATDDDEDVVAVVDFVRHLACVFVSGFNHIAHLVSVKVSLKTLFGLSSCFSHSCFALFMCLVLNICILAALCNYSGEKTESECETKKKEKKIMMMMMEKLTRIHIGFT